MITQTAKAVLFFEDIVERESFNILLKDFYEYYEVTDYKDYIKRYLGLTALILKAEKEGKIDISINEESKKEKSQSFLEKFALSGLNDEIDVDFKVVRNYPLIKIENYMFRIVFPLFAIEKLYNGLYFKFKEINDNLPREKKIKNLRSEITYHFSEKQLLYKLLEISFGKRYLQKSGEEIEKSGNDGFVDYYIRNGNKVFLFESKDILLNAEIKRSYDYSLIEPELMKKLYYEENEGKRIPKAICQLINSTKTLLDRKLNLDKNLKPKAIRVYPILVLHNKQLEILGLNQIINHWFKTELEILKKESYSIEKVRDVVILNIDSLLLFADKIYSKEIQLDEIIDQYLNFTNQENISEKKYKNHQEIGDAFRNTCISFSGFINQKYRWDLPSIFEKKGYSLFN